MHGCAGHMGSSSDRNGCFMQKHRTGTGSAIFKTHECTHAHAVVTADAMASWSLHAHDGPHQERSHTALARTPVLLQVRRPCAWGIAPSHHHAHRASAAGPASRAASAVRTCAVAVCVCGCLRGRGRGAPSPWCHPNTQCRRDLRDDKRRCPASGCSSAVHSRLKHSAIGARSCLLRCEEAATVGKVFFMCFA